MESGGSAAGETSVLCRISYSDVEVTVKQNKVTFDESAHSLHLHAHHILVLIGIVSILQLHRSHVNTTLRTLDLQGILGCWCCAHGRRGEQQRQVTRVGISGARKRLQSVFTGSFVRLPTRVLGPCFIGP